LVVPEDWEGKAVEMPKTKEVAVRQEEVERGAAQTVVERVLMVQE
jgi:hypothetical protein